MAKASLNSALSGAHGRIGDIELRRYRGTTVLQKRQERRAPWSGAQRRHRGMFKVLTDYAAKVRADPELRRFYAQRGAKKKRPLNYWQAAVHDRAHPPHVYDVQALTYRPAMGGMVRIVVADDFEVTRVHVAVRDASGALVSLGDAEKALARWRYTIPPPTPGTSPADSVVVTAFDRPGNFAIGTFALRTA